MSLPKVQPTATSNNTIKAIWASLIFTARQPTPTLVKPELVPL